MWTYWTDCELTELNSIFKWIYGHKSRRLTESLWYFTISVTHAQTLCMNQGYVPSLTHTFFIYNLGLTEAFIIRVHLRHTCAIRIHSHSLWFILLSLIKDCMVHMCTNYFTILSYHIQNNHSMLMIICITSGHIVIC